MSLVHFDGSSFDSGALGSGTTAMVDFWAPWCGPCRMLGPVIEELADELDGSVVVGKVDIDEQPTLAERYGVMTIPTVIVFKDGKEVTRSVGAVPKRKLLELLK